MRLPELIEAATLVKRYNRRLRKELGWIYLIPKEISSHDVEDRRMDDASCCGPHITFKFIQCLVSPRPTPAPPLLASAEMCCQVQFLYKRTSLLCVGVNEEFQGLRVRSLRAVSIVHARRSSCQNRQTCKEQYEIFTAQPMKIQRHLA